MSHRLVFGIERHESSHGGRGFIGGGLRIECPGPPQCTDRVAATKHTEETCNLQDWLGAIGPHDFIDLCADIEEFGVGEVLHLPMEIDHYYVGGPDGELRWRPCPR